jgi:hypothetical protein
MHSLGFHYLHYAGDWRLLLYSIGKGQSYSALSIYTVVVKVIFSGDEILTRECKVPTMLFQIAEVKKTKYHVVEKCAC